MGLAYLEAMTFAFGTLLNAAPLKLTVLLAVTTADSDDEDRQFYRLREHRNGTGVPQL